MIVLLVTGCGSPDTLSTSSVVVTPPAVPVTVVSVTSRPVQRRVSVVGSLVGLDVITVTPEVEGRVTATHFDTGDRVRPGDVLLELDATEYQLAVNEAEKSLQQELSRLRLTSPPSEDFDIHGLPSVVRAGYLLKNAQRMFARQTTLAASNAGLRQELELAETEVRVAEASLQQAEMDATTTVASVRYREAVLAVARRRLEETIVRTPVPGGVSDPAAAPSLAVAQRLVSAGEMVRAFPSTPVYELVLDDVLKLRVKVPERYMRLVRPDLQVEVTVEAYPGEVFHGAISRINPTVDPLSRSFEVEALVQNQDHRLRHGGFAKAEVVLSTSEKAITVPLEAVTRFAGVASVYRIQDGVATAVEVQVGTSGEGWLEVMGDLKDGDVVATSGQSRLADGTAVDVRTSDRESAL